MKSTTVDLSRHVSLQIGLLKFYKMWFFIPYSVKNAWFWVEILTKIVLGITVFLIPTGSQLMYAIKLLLLGNPEIQELAGIINLVLTELLASLRLLDLFLRRDMLIELTDQLTSAEFQFDLKPQNVILEKAVIFSRRLFCVLIICCAGDVLIHVVVVPGMQKFLVLPLKMDFIWIDISEAKYFDYVFAYQILYKPMMVTVFVILQTLPWAAMSCAISQLDVLIYNLENMKDLVKATASEKQCDENTVFKEVLQRCVLHHCAIIRFVNTVQRVFGGQLTATLCLSGAIIGTTAVQIFSIESPLKNMTDVIWVFAYLFVFIANLFIDCYFGNSITVKSLHVSTVVYASPWINWPTSLKKNLVLFIAKTQQPVVIFAAKFAPVSLQTFTTVMNWTYKGFAVMNQMKK